MVFLAVTKCTFIYRINILCGSGQPYTDTTCHDAQNIEVVHYTVYIVYIVCIVHYIMHYIVCNVEAAHL
jgi:hypothetical protein